MREAERLIQEFKLDLHAPSLTDEKVRQIRHRARAAGRLGGSYTYERLEDGLHGLYNMDTGEITLNREDSVERRMKAAAHEELHREEVSGSHRDLHILASLLMERKEDAMLLRDEELLLTRSMLSDHDDVYVDEDEEYDDEGEEVGDEDDMIIGDVFMDYLEARSKKKKAKGGKKKGKKGSGKKSQPKVRTPAIRVPVPLGRAEPEGWARKLMRAAYAANTTVLATRGIVHLTPITNIGGWRQRSYEEFESTAFSALDAGVGRTAKAFIKGTTVGAADLTLTVPGTFRTLGCLLTVSDSAQASQNERAEIRFFTDVAGFRQDWLATVTQIEGSAALFAMFTENSRGAGIPIAGTSCVVVIPADTVRAGSKFTLETINYQDLIAMAAPCVC